MQSMRVNNIFLYIELTGILASTLQTLTELDHNTPTYRITIESYNSNQPSLLNLAISRGMRALALICDLTYLELTLAGSTPAKAPLKAVHALSHVLASIPTSSHFIKKSAMKLAGVLEHVSGRAGLGGWPLASATKSRRTGTDASWCLIFSVE